MFHKIKATCGMWDEEIGQRELRGEGTASRIYYRETKSLINGK
jgi:hypothetical protein